MVWKKEAFQLWLNQWASLYDEDSTSHSLIHSIHDSYFLINVVDHDFVNGDLLGLFDKLPKVVAPKGENVASSLCEGGKFTTPKK